jgi:spore coat polysaccharide biosynthesis predicted glycosyltransferase SpsG
VFLGDLGGLPFAQRQLADRGLPLLPAPVAPEDLADLAVSLGLAAVVLDGYHLDPGCGAALMARGLPVLALSDDGFGADQRATIHLDQNLGAVRPAHLPPGTEALSGVAHVLLRDLVRSRRPAAAPAVTTEAANTQGPTSVLAVFGGTDPTAAVLTLAPLVLATGEPLHLRAIASTPATVEALQRLRPGPRQTLAVLPPADDLPALAVRSDLVVSAAGSSVWELLCLGAPTALVCVTDNQEAGYREVVERGLVEGLGHVASLRDHEPTRIAATARLSTLLRDPGARARLAARGLAEVDGRGRERVADALCRHLDAPATA